MSAVTGEGEIENAAGEVADVVEGDLEALLAQVLSELAGFLPRALDGVLIVRALHDPSFIEVRAIAILIAGQVVEPAEFSLAFGAGGRLAAGSVIRFGNSPAAGVIYGSSAHKHLVNRLLSERPQVAHWAHEFTRSESVWRRSGRVA